MAKTIEFGPYQIIEMIGQGGMGKVYKAFDTNLKRIVALKVLISQEASLIQRFMRETRAMAKLDHPNIIKILQTDTINNTYFFTMDYIEGIPLHKFIKQNHPLKSAETVSILYKIAMAMNYAHSKGIVHRDLKPENIMMRENNEPVVMDFGLAKNSAQDYQLTKTGAVLGSPLYMSPEQAKGNVKDIDERSDIYSLGIIMYHMITGSVPYESRDFSNLLVEIISKNIPVPHRVDKSVPVALSKICNKAIQKNPKERYQKILFFARHLKDYSRNRQVRIYSYQKWKKAIVAITIVLLVVTSFSLVIYSKLHNDQSVNVENSAMDMAKINDSFQNAKSLYRQGFYEQSFNELQKALIETNDNDKIVKIYKYLVLVCVETKEYKQVIDYYDKLPSTLQNNQSLMLAIAKVFYYQKKTIEARDILKSLENTSLKEDLSEIYFYRALIFYDAQDYANAYLLFQKANSYISTNDNRNNIFYYLGVCCYKQKQIVESISYFEKAKQRHPQEQLVYIFLIKCYLQQEELEKTYEVMQAAKTICSKNSEYAILSGKVYEKMANIPLAIESYNRALQMDITSVSALEGMLRINLQQINVRNLHIIYVFKYFNNLTQKSNTTKDILFYEYNEIIDKYKSFYSNWLYLSQKTNYDINTLLKVFSGENSEEEFYNVARKGIAALRYQPGIENQIESVLSTLEKNSQSHARIQELLESVRQKKNIEKNYLAFFYIANVYLYPELFIDNNLNNYIDDDLLFSIYNNTKLDGILRYLAAKTLLKRLRYEILEENTNNVDDDKKIIIDLVRKESADIELPLQNLRKNTNEFLLAMVAKYCNKEQVHSLVNHPSMLVKINLAMNILRKKEPPEDLITKSLKIVKDCMYHQESKYRISIHYAFWGYDSIKVDKFADDFVAGCLDENLEVRLAVLQHYTKLNRDNLFTKKIKKSEPFKNLMQKIFAGDEVFTTRVLAGLWLQKCDPENPMIQEIVKKEDEPFVLRFIFALGGDIVSFAGIMGAINNIEHLIRSENLLLRGQAYYLSAILNSSLFHLLENEKEPILQAGLLMSYRIDRLMGFTQQTVSEKQNVKIAKQYTRSENELVRSAAYSALIVLSPDKEREHIYREILKSKNENEKFGAAVGYYTLIGRDSPNSFDTIIKGSENVNESIEYEKYLSKIEKQILNPKKLNEYKQWLSKAIVLAKHDVFYFERAFISEKEKKYSEALKDLQQASEISPKNRYFIKQADIQIKMNQQREKIESTLEKVNLYNCSTNEFFQIINVYLAINNIKKAFFVLQQYAFLYDNNRREHSMYIQMILAKIYNMQGNVKQSQIHSYYHSRLKK